MSIFFFKIVLTLLAVITFMQSHAQVALEEIVVTAPYSNGELLVDNDSSLLGSDLGKVLSLSIPVFIKNYGPGQLMTVSFRGLQASHTAVTWQGFNLASPALGQADFSLIPLCLFDNISAKTGGSSVKYITGAPAGIIRLNGGLSQNPEVDLFYGSFSTVRSCVKLPFKNKMNKLDIRLFAENSQNNYPYVNSYSPSMPVMQMKNAGYYSYAAIAYFRHDFNTKSHFDFDMWMGYKKRNLPPPLSYEGAGRLEYQQDRILRTVFTYSSPRFEAKFAFSHDSLNYVLADSLLAAPSLFVRNDSKSVSGSAKFVTRFRLGKASVRTVLNYDYIDLEDKNDINHVILSAERFSFETVAEYKTVFYHDIVLETNAGLYADTSFVYPVFTASFVKYFKKFYSGLTFSGNVRIPTLNDLYWYPGGNPLLLPETTKELELSAGYRKLRMAVYTAQVDNWIQWLPTSYHYWRPYNYGRVNTAGAEILFEYDRNFGQKRAVSYKGNLNLNKIFSASVMPFYQPEFVYNGSLKYSHGYWWTDLRSVYSSSRKGGFSTSSPVLLDPYFLADLRFGMFFSFHKMQISLILEANNIFDANYQLVPYRPMPRRNYGITVKLKFI